MPFSRSRRSSSSGLEAGSTTVGTSSSMKRQCAFGKRPLFAPLMKTISPGAMPLETKLPWVHDACRVEGLLQSPERLHPLRPVLTLEPRGVLVADTVVVGYGAAAVLDGIACLLLEVLPLLDLAALRYLAHEYEAVSYTHLTLPTIYSV